MTLKLIIWEYEVLWPMDIVDSDFMNDEFLNHYSIHNLHTGVELLYQHDSHTVWQLIQETHGSVNEGTTLLQI